MKITDPHFKKGNKLRPQKIRSGGYRRIHKEKALKYMLSFLYNTTLVVTEINRPEKVLVILFNELCGTLETESDIRHM